MQPLERLVARHVFAHEPLVALHDLAHAPIDLREVGRVDRLGEVEVVVEAVGDRRADRVPRARVEVAHRLRQHVGGGVAQHVQPLVGVRSDRLHLRVVPRHEREIAQLAVDARGDRPLRERGADRLPLGKLDAHAFGKGQGRHAGMIATTPTRYSYEIASSTFSLAARRAGQIAASTPASPASTR